MNNNWPITTLLLAGLITAGCDSEENIATDIEVAERDSKIEAEVQISTRPVTPGDSVATSGGDRDMGDLELMADITDIPYPIYPNGSKYRIGGEHGLKIIAFETTDSFGKVDRFFTDTFQLARDDKSKALNEVTRNLVMDDLVKYSPALQAQNPDPWAMSGPGIVIHEFSNAEDARAYGASPQSKTNIIMSFR